MCGGQCVLSVNGDGSVNLFDALTMELLDSVRDAHASMIGALHVADDDGSTFLTGGNDKVVQAWVDHRRRSEASWSFPPLETAACSKDQCYRWPLRWAAFDGSELVVADTSSDIKVYGGAS